MDALPQVGQKYQHKKWGEVEVYRVRKLGRGYTVDFWRDAGGFNIAQQGEAERRRDFQKATACKP